MKSKAERSQIDTLLPQDRAAHPHTHTPLCNHMYVSCTHLTDSQRDPRLILKSLHSFGRFFQHLTQQENRGGYEWLMDKNTDRFAFPACSARAHTHTHTHTDISMVTPMKGPLLSLYHVWLILWGSWSALGFSNNCSIPLISYLLSPASSHSLTHSCCGVDLIKVSGCDLLSWTYVHILGETVSLELSNCWKKTSGASRGVLVAQLPEGCATLLRSSWLSYYFRTSSFSWATYIATVSQNL